MKRILLLTLTLMILLSSIALAFQLKSENFSVTFTDADEISAISHSSEPWITVTYKNGDEILYHYSDQTDSFAKFYYLPEKADEHDNGFLDSWVKNIERADQSNGKIVCVGTMPDKNGVFYIKQFDNGSTYAFGGYVLDGKVYVVSKSSKNYPWTIAKNDIRKLTNTIYPR